MFDSLLEELDTLDVEEQKSAFIWALESCALKLEELSYLLESKRDQFIRRLVNNREVSDDTLLANTSKRRPLRRCLEQFEKSENIDMLVECLCGYLFPSKRGTYGDLNPGHIRGLCGAYRDTVMPISHEQEALAELVNRLVFRLYGINPIEADQIKAELRDWHT